MTEIMQNVNSMKLTKLEFKVLQSFKTPSSHEYYPEGHNLEEIATVVFGKDVFNVERRGGRYVGDVNICYAAKSSLSRTLKNLWQKELVKKCQPIYIRKWQHLEDRDGSILKFYGIAQRYLRIIWLRYGRYVVEELDFQFLPDRCHVWWMLTDKAKGLMP